MKENARTTSGYFHLISGIRGFALLNMLLFHFCYDIFIVFGADPAWYGRTPVHIWQQFICITFLFLSGIAFHFGHNNLKKGIVLNLFGLIITAVTLLVMPSQAVWFGILNCIGCCTLLLALLDRLIPAFPPLAGFAISLLLFLLCRGVPDGYLGFGSFRLAVLPEAFYRPRFMTVLGFPYPGFRSSDYFPILPWFFLVAGGYWFWKLVRRYEKCLAFFRIRIPLFSVLGRNTIWIYMLHQPVLYGIAWLIDRSFL